MTTQTTQLPYVITRAVVTDVERLSPTFLRVELGADALSGFGVDGPLLDQRFKLIFPTEAGVLPPVEKADENWFGSWMALPEDQRGSMRTYTVSELRDRETGTRLVVDFALHVADDLGPGTRWAVNARPGQELVVLGPRRGAVYGGIEFTGLEARRILLVGDETAVPAIAAILRDLPAEARGDAVLEVPEETDILELPAPAGLTVHWCARAGAARGEPITSLVQRLAREWSAAKPARAEAPEPGEASGVETAEDLEVWETPTYSSSGVELPELTAPEDFYAWIAGESRVVTQLRRFLVKEVGLQRSQVAFMGYWRDGVAMRG